MLVQVKANYGEGPDLLRHSSDDGASGHAESLAATLTEHRQHLVSIQVSDASFCLVYYYTSSFGCYIT